MARQLKPLPEIEWVPGQKIDRAGIWRNVPMEIYQGDCCVGFSVSTGSLRTVENKSPLHFWDTSPMNPDAAERPDSAAFAFGRAVHTLYAKEAGFWDAYAVRPEDYPDGKTGESKPWNGNSNWCRAWLAKQEKEGRSVLTASEIENIRGMAVQLGKHPIIRDQGLLNGAVERSIIFPVEVPTSRGGVVIIWVKTRPDAMPEEYPVISDYKTCEDASAIACRRAITDYGLHQQLALISWALYAVAKRKTEEHILVFQEKKRPHAVNIKPIDPAVIELGHRQNWRALCKIADGIESGEWHGYDDDTHTAGLMPYAADRLAKEADRMELPTFDPHKVAMAQAPASLVTVIQDAADKQAALDADRYDDEAI